MRRQEKDKIIELLASVVEAQIGIPALIQEDKRDSALLLLMQIQDKAITIGNMIEQSEGEGTRAVALLEAYCEIVFRLYQEIESGNSTEDNFASNLAEMNDILLEETECIEKEIPLRKEAVFLPYNVSMWDSLESVWKKRDEDPEWDAFVIPIPYFDKKPDGSKKQIHYEGDRYPEYVPITHYEAYDFEQRHPDEIYIHNPYDDSNLVTSVHPFFYSKNLRQYTDKLVYIPYFVLPEPEAPDDFKKVEGISHFITLPAVFHADEVVVQSEKMRQAYITVMTNLVGEQSRSIWEKKILGTGSPKYDKIMQAKKEDQIIPEQWMKKIIKKDGTWKKVVLYNTSVGALLRNNEKMIRKIQCVLDEFYNCKDEVTFWWRPHPLMQATIESMRPHLWQDYKAIVDRYRTEDWGIYDDTPDMDRAIIISDAYYGDHSSLVQLCQKRGIPATIQNCSETDSKQVIESLLDG